MTTVNYPNPVTVNGYRCKNCTDVDYAKKNIDPAHPSAGPFGVNAKDRTSQPLAVTFSGALAGISPASGPSGLPAATQGLRLDLSV